MFLKKKKNLVVGVALRIALFWIGSKLADEVLDHFMLG